MDALALAVIAADAADRARVNRQFIAATLLQESAFDPNAISAAGAYGIGQFTAATALDYDVDPFDPRSAIGGATRLLAAYVAHYARSADDKYALALAAYNAGPGTVSYYGGVPPYAETREYIADIHERWARLIVER